MLPQIDQIKIKLRKTILEGRIQLKGCKFVNEIIPYSIEQDLESILLSFKIDVCIRG